MSVETPSKRLTDVTIRRMIRSDYLPILRIDRASYRPTLDDEELDEYGDEGFGGLVAEYHGEVIGFLLYESSPRVYYMDRIAVDPVWRRLGVGKSLVAQMLAKVSHRSNSIECITSDRNDPGHLFLRDCGFTVHAEGILRDHIDEGHDAYLFEY